MTALFNHILNTGITAGILVLVVVLLRFLLKKAPKYVNVLLWGIVALRLIMPISIESSLSLVPKTDWIASENPTVSLNSPESNIEGAESPDFIIDNPAPTQTPTENVPQTPVQNVPQTPVQTTPQAPTTPITSEPIPTVPAENNIRITDVLPYVWLGGVAVMLIYMAFSYYRVHRSIKVVKKLRDNIYLTNTDSPFVLGIINPKIYLPADLDEFSASYVIAHEETHIRRRDHCWKPLGFLLLSVHWFNPLLWLSYILLCKDIEMACDERVVRDMASAERANYSEALLACSISKRVVSACPLAFGEVSVKERIRSVLSYKKPAFWIVLIAVIACIATAVCFLTNPVATSDTEKEETDFGSLEKELPDLLERMYLYEGYYNEAVGVEIDHNDRILDIDSRFCKITDERFDTFAEWVAFAETVFAGAELDRVKSVLEEYVIEIDEHAYINDRVVSVWKFDENTYSIIEEDDTSATVELVRTRVVVGNEAIETYIWTCALEKTDAGWRISDISAEEGVPLIPREWQWLEYEGFTYDLSTVNDKIFRIGEPERIGKHIIVKCSLTSGDTVYVVINASNPYQQIEHSFEGERIAYHSHDVNSIVYSSGNKIYRYDGSVVYEHDDSSEFINAIEYIDNNLTLIITLRGSTRSRTVSVDLSNPTEGHIFEYGGISYDLSSETNSHIQGVLECARVGKHVVAYGDTVGKNGGIFFVINTETHEIENHFIGSILTYHGDDVNTIVYGFLGKIYSYDGTLIAAPEKGYISTMKYVSNFTQLEVTFQTGDTVIVDLPPESPNITHLSEFIIGMQSTELVTIPDVALIDETTVQENEYPVYVNRFASGHAGPMYEINDEYVLEVADNLAEYLYLLYGENIPTEEFSVNAFADYIVEYKKDGIEFSSNADRITVSFPKSEMDAEITEGSAKTNAYLAAAMKYLDIDEPILKTTLDYNLKNEPSWYSYIFSESTTDHSEYLWNTTFNYAEIWGCADLDSWHLSITKYDSPKIHSTPEIIPYSAAVAYIKANFPDVDTTKLTAEIYYARPTGTDCFIPCYRFYFPSDTPNITTHEIPEFCEYYIDIPMISADLIYPVIPHDEIKLIFNKMILLDKYRYDPLGYLFPGVDVLELEPYLKVTDERYDTYAEWMAFIESIYTGKQLEQINGELKDFAIDVDGYTYVTPTAFTNYFSDEYTYKIVESDENTAKITLTRTYAPVGLESTEEEFTYLLTKTGAGWRISDRVSK